MTFHATNFMERSGVENAADSTRGYALPMLPVTAAVVLGPLVNIVYDLTRSAGAQIGSFSSAQAIRGLFCVLMLLSLFFSKGLSLFRHRLICPLLFLAVWAVLTAPVGPYPRENIVFAVRLAFVMLIFANACRLAQGGLCRERWLMTCAWAVLLTMVLSIGAGLVLGRTVPMYGSRFATAGLSDSPFIAAFLILSSLPVFIRAIPNGGAAVVALVLLLAALFFTMCRTAIIAALAAVGTCSLINLCFSRRITWRRALVFAGAVALTAAVILSTRAGKDLMERFRELNPLVGTGSGRYVFWRIAGQHIVNRPLDAQLLGEGMGNIRHLMQEKFGMPIFAHNDWLEFTNAFGLLGLMGIGWWHLEWARFAWGLRRRRGGLFQGACACTILLALISIGTGGFYDPAWALTYAALGFWAGSTELPVASGSLASGDRRPVTALPAVSTRMQYLHRSL